MTRTYFVYILQCCDSSYYIGLTENLDIRLQQHNEGRGGQYTCSRRPVVLVYSERHSGLENALRRERQLKRWTKEKKAALIAGDRQALKGYSRRRRKDMTVTRS